MITFTHLQSGIKVAGPDHTLVVFPKDAGQASDKTTVVFSVPEENPAPHTVSWPGEYNIQNVTLRGVAHADGQQVSYMAHMDGVRLAFLSTPLAEWTDTQLESVGDIDVLVMPAGDAKVMQKLVDEFDPRVLILVPGSGDTSAFKSLGAKDEVVSEWKLKGSLPQEGREVVVLEK